jgi:hypothetical protein
MNLFAELACERGSVRFPGARKPECLHQDAHKRNNQGGRWAQAAKRTPHRLAIAPARGRQTAGGRMLCSKHSTRNLRQCSRMVSQNEFSNTF